MSTKIIARRNKIKTNLKKNYTKYWDLYGKTGKKEYRTKFRDIKATLDELFREELERWKTI